MQLTDSTCSQLLINLPEFPDIRGRRFDRLREPSVSVCLRSLATVILMGFSEGYGQKLTKTL